MRKLFVFDCDDILLDWCRGMRAYLIKKYPDIQFNTYWPLNYDLDGWIASDNIPPASQFMQDYANSDDFLSLEPLDYAVDSIRNLKKYIQSVGLDIEFCVLTKCGLGHNGITMLNRIMNIKTVFGDNAFDSIYVIETDHSKHDILQELKNRYEVCAVIDDNVKNNYISSCLNIPSYILQRSHNLNASLPNDVVLCADWPELYTYLYDIISAYCDD